MKKLSNLLLLGVMTLTGATLFTACTSENDTVAEEVNPTFDGQSVKTQFAINIPQANSSTRMSATTTQNDGNFRGIQDLYLFPLSTEPTGTTPFPYANIKLGESNGDYTQITDNRQQRLYSDVNIAVGTNNFLFYGEATHGSLSSIADRKINGILDKTLSTDLANTSAITFDLVQIASASLLSTAKTALLKIMNDVAAAKYNDGTDHYWRDLKATDTDKTYAALQEAYTQFTQTDRYYNGSAEGVRLAVQALFNNVYYTKKGSTNAVVVGVCDAIMNILAGVPDATTKAVTPDANKPFNATYDSEKDGKESATSGNFLADPYTLAYNSTDAGTTNFPVGQGLPQGAAQMKCAKSSDVATFSYVNPIGFYGNDGNATDIENLRYPASLQYYVNTPLKATNKTLTTSDWPQTTTAWATDATWTGWTDAVSASTKNIALRDNIQYGVARLALQVKCADAATLKDNSAAAGYEADQDISYTGFQVTGVFVGGQPQRVGWNFLPVSGTSFDRVVVDDQMNTTITATRATYSAKNYTLLLDNYKADATDTEKQVNVCIELTNSTGRDFYGQDGLIRAGQKFYLVGRLDPNATTGKSGEINYPTTRYPAKNKERVFMQDFTTTVQLTITSLKGAYVTIPDLRIPQIQLGLSVDLQWNPGITYEISTFQ
ncbi:MAG: hypothetical protein K5928_00725 [Prevotella sp.]|nr:hypothetical protein [Prevotella sp.]